MLYELGLPNDDIEEKSDVTIWIWSDKELKGTATGDFYFKEIDSGLGKDTPGIDLFLT